ncbi:MAG: 50S ribosomal protein L15 [Patescibacteria group bacterium]
MPLNLSNLKPAKGSKRKSRRVGRGGKRGTYSGRGMKGQRARSGGKGGLKLLGLKQTLRRIPKKRGFQSLNKKFAVVNLADLEKKFQDGDVINARLMIRAGLIRDTKNGIKILGAGKLTKKLTVVANAFSASAQKAIEEGGGKIQFIKSSKS